MSKPRSASRSHTTKRKSAQAQTPKVVKKASTKPTTRELREMDRELIRTLESASTIAVLETPFRNSGVARLACQSHTAAGLTALESELRRNGTLDVNVEVRRWKDTDGATFQFALARATSTEMWPMGTNYWVRDNALIAARLLFGESAPASVKVGKQILMSGLTFMSSVAQLDRFKKIVSSTSPKVIADPNRWPHIFASVKENLNTAKTEPWSHKQDAWQILAWYLLDAIECGIVTMRELTAKHRAFLGYIVPFLGKVSFWKCENSGSWEEIPAVRSSVIAWEHMLVARLTKLAETPRFDFLRADFERHRRTLGAAARKATLARYASRLDRSATKRSLAALPYESPSYGRRDPRYREADSALMYLLQIGYVPFLAERAGKDERWVRATELEVFGQVESLFDKRVGGFKRYINDSYQRNGYFRHVTTARLAELYGGSSGNASSDFTGRNKIVPKGREAAWAHFTWQVAAWAGRMYLRDGASRFLKLHEKYFAEGLRLVTGAKEASIDQDSSGTPRVTRIAAWLMPECYISELSNDSEVLVFPSPHTPLNWAVGEMRDAIAVRKKVVKAKAEIDAGLSRRARLQPA